MNVFRGKIFMLILNFFVYVLFYFFLDIDWSWKVVMYWGIYIS